MIFARDRCGQWTDPLGRRVRLSKATWQHHISVGHIEMDSNFENIWRTIENPDRIVQDGKEVVFERMCDLEGFAIPRRGYIWVVVGWRKRKIVLKKGKKWTDKGVVGDVRTAYTAMSKRRGDQIWPTEN